MQWIGLAMNATMILLFALTLQNLWEKNLDPNRLYIRLGIIFATLVIRWIVIKAAARMSYLASKTIKRVMREHIYKKLLRLGTSYREHVSTAALVQDSVEGVEQLENYFGQYVPQFFYAFIAPVTLFFLFGAAGSFKVASVLLVCVPLIPASIIVIQKIAKRLLGKYWAQYTQLGSTFLENLQGMTTLKIYQADEFKNQQMNKESENFRAITMKVLTMQLNSIIIMDLFAYGGAALGIGLACYAFFKTQLTLGATVFMILLSADFFLPMRKLGSYFHVAMTGMAASDKIFTFLNTSLSQEKSKQLPLDGGDIIISNLSFSYTADREVLHNINLEIPQNGFVGIVGASGSGKSTIASLIMGRNHASCGEITIAGKNLASVCEKSLLKTVTYVGLGSIFFKGTVKENLLLADPKASDETLWKALTASGIADFFREAQGLDTPLLENAQNLSGGQRQRLALARALLHDSPVYIFDEATSNIDVESEEAILNEIKALAKIKTVVMITHRLANVTSADFIYCLEDGKIAGKGTHQDLQKSCNAYAALWKTQKELEDFVKEAKRA